VQYDVAFAGYGISSDYVLKIGQDSLTLNLAQYSNLIVPDSRYLSDEQVQSILAFANTGGHVIAWDETWGNVGQFDPDGNQVSRPELEALLTPGTHTVGSGYFTYFPDEDIGEIYYNSHDPTVRNRVGQVLFRNYSPFIETNAPATVNIYAYANTDSSTLFLHCLNFNFSEGQNRIVPEESLRVKVKPFGAIDTSSVQVNLISPEYNEPATLPVSIDSGRIAFTIPQLHIYDVVYLISNASAPQIIAYSPRNDTTISEGESLRFSVTAVDPDRNPLTYSWFINDSLQIIKAPASEYLLKTNYESAGTDTVIVKISDGRFEARHTWIVRIEDKERPRLLFDESHGEINTISLERAKELNPQHPEWIYFGTFKDEIEKEVIKSLSASQSGTLFTHPAYSTVISSRLKL
jgi:hypothetical protein